jgi:hypothetical protein
VVLSYLGASAEVISSADACNRQYWRSLRLMYRHQRICSACPGSLWHGAGVGRRLSRGTRHLVSADLRVLPLSVRTSGSCLCQCGPPGPASVSADLRVLPLSVRTSGSCLCRGKSDGMPTRRPFKLFTSSAPNHTGQGLLQGQLESMRRRPQTFIGT